jgi:hypothetical protein
MVSLLDVERMRDCDHIQHEREMVDCVKELVGNLVPIVRRNPKEQNKGGDCVPSPHDLGVQFLAVLLLTVDTERPVEKKEGKCGKENYHDHGSATKNVDRKRFVEGHETIDYRVG